MASDERQRARSLAYQLATDLARAHAAELAQLSSEGEVETALSGPIDEARARYRKKIGPKLHHVFEDALADRLVRPVVKRAEEDGEAADREAVREDLGYRTAEARERPKPKPKPKKPPAPRAPRLAPGLAEYRQTGTIFLGIGALLTVGMGALAIGMARSERHAARVQGTFVIERCTIVESRDTHGEGGTLEHVIAFEHEAGGRKYRSDRYSPDVPHGPGASWFPVGRVVGCYCAPDDPAECYLDKGQDKDREAIPWVLILLFPALWLGIGFAMRGAQKLPEGD